VTVDDVAKVVASWTGIPVSKIAESETAKYRSDMYEKREEEHKWMVDLYKYWNVDSSEIREFLARRYIERIVGCIENVTNKNCELNKLEKKNEIKKMISTAEAKEAVKIAKPKSNYMRLALFPIKLNNATLTYAEGCVISKVKSTNTKVFAKLKANR